MTGHIKSTCTDSVFSAVELAEQWVPFQNYIHTAPEKHSRSCSPKALKQLPFRGHVELRGTVAR